jgi:CO dehydrogenase maturation factor
MGYLIAVTGKGGTGKTTVTASLVRLLLYEEIRPVLAVDADPNSTLAPLLGLTPGRTISDVREEIMRAKASVTGVPKERMLKFKLEECIIESAGFDLLIMGRPEGQVCYCYVNTLLRAALATLRGGYKVTVVDNEAGMEHLSRMNTDDIDCLVVLSEPTLVSARTAARIVELARSLPVRIGRRVLVWNKVPPTGISEEVYGALPMEGFDSTVTLLFDEGVAQLAIEEKSVLSAKLPPGFARLFEACIANGQVILSK